MTRCWPFRRPAEARRASGNVALGSYQWAVRPRPHGVDQLGRRLVEVHGGVEAALGVLALELYRQETSP